MHDETYTVINKKKRKPAVCDGKAESGAKTRSTLNKENCRSYLDHLANQETLLTAIEKNFRKSLIVNPTMTPEEFKTGPDVFQILRSRMANLRGLIGASSDVQPTQRPSHVDVLKACYDIDELLISLAVDAEVSTEGTADYYTMMSEYASQLGGRKSGLIRREADPLGIKQLIRTQAETLKKNGTNKRSWAAIILGNLQRDENFCKEAPSLPTIRKLIKDIL